jgi:hypothetical protein
MPNIEVIPSFSLLRNYVILILVVLFSCNKPVTKEEKLYYELECKNIDSLWRYYQTHGGISEHGAELVNKVNASLAHPTTLDSGRKLIDLMEGHSKAKPEPHFLAYFYAMQSRLAWYKGNDSLGNDWHYKWLSFESFATDMNVISHYLDLGNVEFSRSNFDSAIVHYRKALLRSQSSDDEFFRITILNNLGAAYFYTHLMSLASDCFAEVLVLVEEKFRNDPTFNLSNHDLTIIRANLMATLNQESNFSQAREVFAQHETDALKPDVEPFAQQLFLLNHVYTLIKTNEIKLAETYLGRLKQDSILPNLLSFYIGLQGAVHAEKENYEALKNLLTMNREWLMENLVADLSDFREILILAIEKGLIQLDYGSILAKYEEIRDEGDAFVNANFCHLLATILRQQGREIEALEWDLASRDFDLSFQNEVDEFKISDVRNKIELAKLKSEIRNKEELIKSAESRQKFLLGLVSISIAFLIAIGYLLLTLNKSRKQRLELLTLESEKQAQSIELLRLQNEKQMNSIMSSNFAVKQLEHIIHKMREPNLLGNPLIVGFRQDLEQLLAVEFNVAMGSQGEAAETVEDYEYLKIQFPLLAEWNETAFKILVLSVLENQPKEIAKLLSLNMQYVRNVRSKLKKMLSEQIKDDWDWPDLKKFRNA